MFIKIEYLMEFSPIVKVPFQRTEKEDCFSICFNFKIFNSDIDYLTNVLTRNDYPPNFIDLRVQPFLKVNRLIQKTNFVTSAKTLSKAIMIKHTKIAIIAVLQSLLYINLLIMSYSFKVRFGTCNKKLLNVISCCCPH